MIRELSLSYSSDGVQNSSITPRQVCFIVLHRQDRRNMYEAYALSANDHTAVNGHGRSTSHTRCNLIERAYSNGVYEYGRTRHNRCRWRLSH